MSRNSRCEIPALCRKSSKLFLRRLLTLVSPPLDSAPLKNNGKVGQVAPFGPNPNAPRTSDFAIDGEVAPVILVISLDPAQPDQRGTSGNTIGIVIMAMIQQITSMGMPMRRKSVKR
jgi:hypothetical protein